MSSVRLLLSLPLCTWHTNVQTNACQLHWLYRVLKSLCAPYSMYSNNSQPTDDLKMAITEYIRNVDRAMLNTVFENTVRRIKDVWRLAGALWTLLVTFLIVVIRSTETFWSPCTFQFRFKTQRAINDNIFIYVSKSCNAKFLRNIFYPTKLIITFIFKY